MGNYDIEDLKQETADDSMFRMEGDSLKEKQRNKAKEEEATRKEILRPGAVGSFEKVGAEAGPHLVAPLRLSAKVHENIADLDVYQAGYNMYCQPMQLTLQQMGRLKDLQRAGTPQSPKELKQDKRLAQRFRKVSLSDKKDTQKQLAFNQWQKRQTDLEVHFVDSMNARHLLLSAVTKFRGAQNLLDARSKELEMSSKMNEKAKIDRAAETLAKIVSISTQAWNAANYIDAFAEQTFAAKDTSGSHPDDGEWKLGDHYDDKGKWNVENVGSGGGKAAKKAEVVYGAFKKINETDIVQRAKASSGISLKDVFIIAMGDSGRYAELQAEIAKLSAQVANLRLDAESLEIEAAKQALDAFTMNLSAKQAAVRADLPQARGGAQIFAQSMGGGDKGVMAMYAAETLQELEIYGEQAHQDRRTAVDPWQRSLRGLIGKGLIWWDARYLNQDYAAIKDNLYGVKGQREVLETNRPGWKTAAREWREYLFEITAKDLNTNDGKRSA